jgi:hypothetical protein
MKRERAMRVHRQHGKPMTRRCGVCAKNRCRRLPVAQEATVPQVFSLSPHDARHAPSMSPRLIAAGKKRPAWTLSRGFWQQKNFSCSPASSLVSARQNRFFARIARGRFGRAISFFARASTIMVND